MSSFDGQDLFSSGPHRFEVGGLTLRHAEQAAPGGDGAAVVGQGRSARTIVQHGELLADSAAFLRELTALIEAKLDGLEHELIDDAGRLWSNVVMVKFEPEVMKRIGTRLGVSYRVEYVQVKP